MTASLHHTHSSTVTEAGQALQSCLEKPDKTAFPLRDGRGFSINGASSLAGAGMQERGDKLAEQVVPEQRLAQDSDSAPLPAEFGGPEGPEPTRYGDWERRGRCSDF